jgi:hypothetical protein
MFLLSHLHFWSWTVLVLLLGYSLGTLVLRMEEAFAPAPVKVLDCPRWDGACLPSPRGLRRAPVVHVRRIEEGKIVGTVGTGARLIVGDEAVLPQPDRSFAIDAVPFLVNIVPVPVPPGTQFVASRRGKRYYPVSSAAAERLVPENRIYFERAEEAEAAGYSRGR